jgi:TRAP-type C4-dicarboxylate transport system permease small subunit
MEKMEQLVKQIVSKVNTILEKVLAVFTAVMALILIANVFTRYLFSYSLTWSAELARYCMVWSAFLGIAVLVNRNQHLAVDLLDKALPEAPRRVLQALVHGLSALLFAILTGYGAVLVAQTRGQVAASIRLLPMNLVYSIIPFSGAIMLAGELIHLVRLAGKGDSR